MHLSGLKDWRVIEWCYHILCVFLIIFLYFHMQNLSVVRELHFFYGNSRSYQRHSHFGAEIGIWQLHFHFLSHHFQVQQNNMELIMRLDSRVLFMNMKPVNKIDNNQIFFFPYSLLCEYFFLIILLYRWKKRENVIMKSDLMSVFVQLAFSRYIYI